MHWSEILGLVLPIIGVTGVFVLAGLKGWSNHQLKMRGTPDGDSERLNEAVQQLNAEVGAMREDLVELQERVEFTERMLTEVRSKNVIGPGGSV